MERCGKGQKSRIEGKAWVKLRLSQHSEEGNANLNHRKKLPPTH